MPLCYHNDYQSYYISLSNFNSVILTKSSQIGTHFLLKFWIWKSRKKRKIKIFYFIKSWHEVPNCSLNTTVLRSLCYEVIGRKLMRTQLYLGSGFLVYSFSSILIFLCIVTNLYFVIGREWDIWILTWMCQC